MDVETDLLVALVKEDDWFQDEAVGALEAHDDVHTSILSCAELLVLLYDRNTASYEIDAPRGVTNLLELVPIEPLAHEEAVLAAAAFIDEHELTPFDALHADIATVNDERVLSSEQAYDRTGVERTPLDSD